MIIHSCLTVIARNEVTKQSFAWCTVVYLRILQYIFVILTWEHVLRKNLFQIIRERLIEK